MIAAVDEPVEGLPVLLSQSDEHLVGAVELLAILHPHDVGLCHALHSAAQPRRVPLRHRLIGWVLGEVHTCNKDKPITAGPLPLSPALQMQKQRHAWKRKIPSSTCDVR